MCLQNLFRFNYKLLVIFKNYNICNININITLYHALIPGLKPEVFPLAIIKNIDFPVLRFGVEPQRPFSNPNLQGSLCSCNRKA